MSCDCDMPSAWTEKVRVARKPHRCSECRGWIAFNEEYFYASGIYENGPESFHLHLLCEKWRSDYQRFIREMHEEARLIVSLSTSYSYVGNVAPIKPTKAEVERARDILCLCDCVAIGELGEAMKEAGGIL